MPATERNDHRQQRRPQPHNVTIQLLLVVVVPHVSTHLWAAGLDTRFACRHAGRTVSSLAMSRVRRAVSEGSRLSRSLAFPADCLHLRIVTSISQHRYFTGSAGYSGFPAYSRILIT